MTKRKSDSHRPLSQTEKKSKLSTKKIKNRPKSRPGLLTVSLRSNAEAVGCSFAIPSNPFTHYISSLSQSNNPIHVQHLLISHAFAHIPVSTPFESVLSLYQSILPVFAAERLLSRLTKTLSKFIQFSVDTDNDAKALLKFLISIPFLHRITIIHHLCKHAVEEQAATIYDKIFNGIKSSFGLRQATRILPACSSSVVERTLDQFIPYPHNDASWRQLCTRHSNIVEKIVFNRNERDYDTSLLTPSVKFMDPKQLFDRFISYALELSSCPIGIPRALKLLPVDGVFNTLCNANDAAIRLLFFQETYYSYGYGSTSPSNPSNALRRLIRALSKEQRFSLLDKCKHAFGLYQTDSLTLFMRVSAPSQRIDYFEHWFNRTNQDAMHLSCTFDPIFKLLPSKNRFRYLRKPTEDKSISEHERFWKFADPSITWPVMVSAYNTNDQSRRLQVINLMSFSVAYNRNEKHMQRFLSFVWNRTRKDITTRDEALNLMSAEWTQGLWMECWNKEIEAHLTQLFQFMISRKGGVIPPWISIIQKLLTVPSSKANSNNQIIQWAVQTLKICLQTNRKQSFKGMNPCKFRRLVSNNVAQQLKLLFKPFLKVALMKDEWKHIVIGIELVQFEQTFLDEIVENMLTQKKNHHPCEEMKTIVAIIIDAKKKSEEHGALDDWIANILQSDPSFLMITKLWTYVSTKIPAFILQLNCILNGEALDEKLLFSTPIQMYRWSSNPATRKVTFVPNNISKKTCMGWPKDVCRLLKEHTKKLFSRKYFTNYSEGVNLVSCNPFTQLDDYKEIAETLAKRQNEDENEELFEEDEKEYEMENEVGNEAAEDQEEDDDDEEEEEEEGQEEEDRDVDAEIEPAKNVEYQPLSVTDDPHSKTTETLAVSVNEEDFAYHGEFKFLNVFKGNRYYPGLDSLLCGIRTTYESTHNMLESLISLMFHELHCEERLPYYLYGHISRNFGLITAKRALGLMMEQIEMRDGNTKAGRVSLIKFIIHLTLSGKFICRNDGLNLIRRIFDHDRESYQKKLKENPTGRIMKPVTMHNDVTMMILKTCIDSYLDDTPEWVWDLLDVFQDQNTSAVKLQDAVNELVRKGFPKPVHTKIISVMMNLARFHSTWANVQVSILNGALEICMYGQYYQDIDNQSTIKGILSALCDNLKDPKLSSDYVSTTCNSLLTAVKKLEQSPNEIIGLTKELIQRVISQDLKSNEYFGGNQTDAKWFSRLSALICTIAYDGEHNALPFSNRVDNEEDRRRTDVLRNLIVILKVNSKMVKSLDVLIMQIFISMIRWNEKKVDTILEDIEQVATAGEILMITKGISRIVGLFKNKKDVVHDIAIGLIDKLSQGNETWKKILALKLLSKAGYWFTWPLELRNTLKFLRNCSDANVSYDALTLNA